MPHWYWQGCYLRQGRVEIRIICNSLIAIDIRSNRLLISFGRGDGWVNIAASPIGLKVGLVSPLRYTWRRPQQETKKRGNAYLVILITRHLESPY